MENNTVLWVGIIGAILSPIVSIMGIYMAHLEKTKLADNEKTKIQADLELEAIRVKAEADKIEAETGKLTIENNSAQIQYYINIVESLRKEVAFFLEHSRELTDKVSSLEMKLTTAEREKNILIENNEKLKSQVNIQEKEIAELRNKVSILEGKSSCPPPANSNYLKT